MISASLSYFDVAVVAILALSCLFAFFRGLVKEILSLGAWIGAGLITIYFFPDLAKALEPRFKSPTVAAGIATLGIYITALLIFSGINSLILRYVKEGSDVGFLDNTLGLLFGAFRGMFVISLAYMVMTMVMTEEEYPKWIKEAHTRPFVEKGAVLLARASPHYLQEISNLKDASLARAKESGIRSAMPGWLKDSLGGEEKKDAPEEKKEPAPEEKESSGTWLNRPREGSPAR